MTAPPRPWHVHRLAESRRHELTASGTVGPPRGGERGTTEHFHAARAGISRLLRGYDGITEKTLSRRPQAPDAGELAVSRRHRGSRIARERKPQYSLGGSRLRGWREPVVEGAEGSRIPLVPPHA